MGLDRGARRRDTDALLAVDELDRVLTFGEYRARCLAQADALRELGIDAGTVVSWQLPTWLESLVIVGALARLGAVQNPILPICRAREVGFMVRQTGAQFLIVPGPDPWRGFDYVEMAEDLGSARYSKWRGVASLFGRSVPPEGARSPKRT